MLDNLCQSARNFCHGKHVSEMVGVQVHGLSAEYDRLNRQHSSSSGPGAIEAATSKLQSALATAEKEKAAYLVGLVLFSSTDGGPVLA